MVVLLVGLEIFLYINHERKKLKKQQEFNIYQEKKQTPAFYRNIYALLSSWSLTRGYIARIRRKHEMIDPSNIEKIEQDTVKSAMSAWITAIVLTVIALIIHVSLYSVLLVIYTVIVVNSEYLNQTTKRKRDLLLKQQKTEMENLQNAYNRTEEINDALYETAVNAPDPIRGHLSLIWEILQMESGAMDNEIEKYNASAPNPFLKDLLAVSKEVSKYGDSKVNGISNYIRKLSGIINSISSEQRKDDDVKHYFAFHAFVCIFPVYMKLILNKATTSMFAAENYIHGTYGIISTILVFIISYGLYRFISQKKDMDFTFASYHPHLQNMSKLPVIKDLVTYMNGKNQYKTDKLESKLHQVGESMTVRQFAAKQILCFVIGTILTLFLCLGIGINSHYNALNETDNISNQILNSIEEEQEEDVITFVTSLAKEWRGGINEEELRTEIKDSGYFITDNAVDLVYEEILKRVNIYHTAIFKFYYFIISILIGAACMYIPHILISRNTVLIKLRSNDEVMRFQNIISCMKNTKRASTKEILTEMEISADIYRKSLTQCVDQYASDPINALKEFKKRERENELLQQICVKFIRADRVGVLNAFANLEEEIEEARKVREQKYRDYISDTASMTYMLAFIPLLSELVFEMIIPMILATATQLTWLNNI